jgi:hypothetical protein
MISYLKSKPVALHIALTICKTLIPLPLPRLYALKYASEELAKIVDSGAKASSARRCPEARSMMWR